ncbi:MAG: phosphoglucosamine mutase [Gemmatimonadota bacterium]
MKRLFGTDGIRGTAGVFPLDDATIARIGEALVPSLASRADRPRILIGRDTRESGPTIESALARGIEAAGGSVHRGGVLTTPAVAGLTRDLGYDAGVVISASHNPYGDNGIKVFSREGYKLPDSMEASIEARILDGAGEGAPNAHSGQTPRRTAREPDADSESPRPDLHGRYMAMLLAAIPSGTSFSGRRVVLDCANGAAFSLGPELFRRAGAEVLTINDKPDGRNINEGCGALHPQRLGQVVVERQAQLGLAFDGDADRCLAVDPSGRVLDGDYILYLAARDLKSRGALPGNAVIGTVMSNLWLERSLRAEGIALRRAPVGDKYVLEEMQRGGFVLGGEQSGHIIYMERATTGDGLLTGLLLLDLVARTSLDLAAWAATIHPCPQILVNVPVRSRPVLEDHPSIGPAIRKEEVRLRDRGRLLVRYSGTEPKARVMVEGESKDAIEATAERLRIIIQEAIGQAPS